MFETEKGHCVEHNEDFVQAWPGIFICSSCFEREQNVVKEHADYLQRIDLNTNEEYQCTLEDLWK